MEIIYNLLFQSLEKVWITFTHNWPFLLASVLISVALRLYIKPEKASAFLARYRRAGVVGATAVAVTTPFCSCGTTAVMLGMIASTVPWAPIVAFMVASPLTSPEEMIYSAGLFGWPFAVAFFVSSILLGLLGGLIAEIFESRGWLANQARFARAAAAPAGVVLEPQTPIAVTGDKSCSCGSGPRPANMPAPAPDIRSNQPFLVTNPPLALATCCGPSIPTTTRCGCQSEGAAAPVSSCGCGTTVVAAPAPSCSCGSKKITAPSCGCGTETPRAAEEASSTGTASTEPASQKVTARQWIQEIYRTGKQLLVMFLGFAFIGYVLNGLIPSAWIAAIFGPGHAYSVPLAATLGLPLYINTEGSLPLVRALIDGGMSQGAALAFLITGAGTSLGAVAGALTSARWRVIALVIGTLWVGAVVLGFGYDLMLAAHLFS